MACLSFLLFGTDQHVLVLTGQNKVKPARFFFLLYIKVKGNIFLVLTHGGVVYGQRLLYVLEKVLFVDGSGYKAEQHLGSRTSRSCP